MLDLRHASVGLTRHRVLELDLWDLDEGRIEVGQGVPQRLLHERRVVGHAAGNGALRHVRLLQLHRHWAVLIRVETLDRVGEDEVEVEQVLVGRVVAAWGDGRRRVGHGASRGCHAHAVGTRGRVLLHRDGAT